ncbi:MAG: ABC transporter substrate-binding protein [Spirochaetes bacterium]|nr:ABC transporter substrate-binding protein [Spirochaetota bacterium]
MHRIHSKKELPNWVLRIVLAWGLLSCPGLQSVRAQEQTIRVAIGYIPHIQFAPLYLGIEKGFYREEGLRLEIEYGFGMDIFSLLAAGKIDLGLSDSDQLIIAASKGVDLRAIFQYYQKYPVTILAKADRIKTPEDFKGKTIGTPELYGTSWIGLQLFLERFQLKEKVKIERIGYTQISTLLADRVDGAVCFSNNEPIQLKESGIRIVQWDVKDFSSMVGASFITSTSILSKKQGVLGAFVRATEKAIRYTIQHQEEAYQVSYPYIGKPDPVKGKFLQTVLKETCTLFETTGPFGSIDPTVYKDSISTLKRLGLIDREVPVEKIIQRLH